MQRSTKNISNSYTVDSDNSVRLKIPELFKVGNGSWKSRYHIKISRWVLGLEHKHNYVSPPPPPKKKNIYSMPIWKYLS